MTKEARILPDQFRHCSNLMRRMYHQNGPMNTRHGQGKLLNQLLTMDGASQKDLLVEMRIRSSSLNELVRKAECNGFITRTQNEDDNRISNIYLTDEGRIIAQKRADANEKVAQEIFADFSQEERDQLENLLSKLSDSLEEKTCSEDNSGRKHHHRSMHSRRYDGHSKSGGRRMRKNDQYASRAS